jgi:hypothetical protein
MAAPRVPIDALPAASTVTDTDLLVVQNGPTTKRMTVGQLTAQNTTAVDAHINNITAAHIASAIAATPNTTPLTGTDVQSQLAQAAAAIVALQAAVDSLEARVP